MIENQPEPPRATSPGERSPDAAGNPVLSDELPVPFHRLRPADIVDAARRAVAAADSEVEAIAAGAAPRTFEGTLRRLDAALDRVERVADIAEHLASVAASPAMRAAHGEAQALYERFFARVETSPGLWRALDDFAGSDEGRTLAGPRRFFLRRALRELEHAGAALPADRRARVEALRVELSELGTRFEDQVLDSLNEFELHLRDEGDVAGLPPSSLSLARDEAGTRGLDGWVFTLHAPSYMPFMRYSERRELRRRMHEAFTHVAAAAPHDNLPVIGRILEARQELAALLGADSFADYALELNMVGSAAAATEFVARLTFETEPHFRKESGELEAFARGLGIDELQAWDVHYVAERLRLERYDIDQEALRPYFPLPRVLHGLFEVAQRLFGVHIEERATEAIWYPDVRYFELRNEAGEHRASFYLDLFPRASKRGGAWKASLAMGGPTPDGGFRPHLLTICANLSPPSAGRPALLTHGEVETLFHEFGHLLHGALSETELRTRAGTKVPRDFVELPSQIMENWCWEPEALPLFSAHVDTGEPVPADVVARLRASRDFRAASAQMRQLGFGAVDLDLHLRPPAEPLARAQEILGRYAIHPGFARNAFLCSFTHIFGGGYAAAYHSYKWAEMLDADAFTRFSREGLFSREVGEAFAREILRRGLSDEPAAMYRAFMGRDPDITPLLRRTLPAAESAG